MIGENRAIADAGRETTKKFFRDLFRR